MMRRKKILMLVSTFIVVVVVLFLFRSKDTDAAKPSRLTQEPNSGTNIQPGPSDGAADEYASTPADVALSPLDRLDNEQEIKRMREHLPGNGFIPGEVGETERRAREQTTRDIVYLGAKVRKGTATPAEAKKYYTLKIKETDDKLQFFRYTIERTQELTRETGRRFLEESELKASRDAMASIANELDTYKAELAKL